MKKVILIATIVLIAVCIGLSKRNEPKQYSVNIVSAETINNVPKKIFMDAEPETEVKEVNLLKECSAQKIIGYKKRTVTKKVKIRQKKYLGTFRISYYCPCVRCCGKSNGKTSIGRKATVNRTVAVNPRVIPYRTRLKVGNRWTYVAEDTGGMRGKHLDIFVSSHSQALRLGIAHKKVWSWKYIKRKKKFRIKIPIYEEPSYE
jgi:3D (Asp-Asp-Asp) domain-containing protein